jgi:hypothetical protein
MCAGCCTQKGIFLWRFVGGAQKRGVVMGAHSGKVVLFRRGKRSRKCTGLVSLEFILILPVVLVHA